MTQKRIRLVLREHSHFSDAGIKAVGQRKINNAELPAEMNRRLGSDVREIPEAGAPPAGQHQSSGSHHGIKLFRKAVDK